ncbi:hypothetical protein CK203_053043 [Vitis vinifera]|uniref:Uncharacterized protein n=1 Tax=Vitis vinifera TaxID=29760 RepID=A0A438FMH8_VITVI|nr:hypothetical protein CK203_053043 [Vitis vinifera]
MLKLMIDSEMDEYRVAKLTTVADNMKNSPHILTKKGEWLKNFSDVAPKELPNEHPLLCTLQHLTCYRAAVDKYSKWAALEETKHKPPDLNGSSMAFWQLSRDFVKQEKGGAKDLKDFKPISLVGGYISEGPDK